jgi:hypothetical protein
VWRRLAFLLIAGPLALLAFVLLLMNFGTMPRSDLAYALAVAYILTMVAMPIGVTIWGFSILMSDRRGRRERP